jgi:alpha-L-fucosidase
MKKIIIILIMFGFAISANCQEINDKIVKTYPLPKSAKIDRILDIASHVKPTQQQVEWQEQEFTFFIHFGINTFTDREWGLKQDDSKQFNPSALDINQWAKTVKEAGGKTMIVLAKHHDGFCYWPSKYTEYSVKNSPWKNGKSDLIKEASEACKKYGIKLGIYLSPWDMVSRIYGTDAYNEHFRNQLTELLTNYGKVAEVWFDGACGEGPNGVKQVYDWKSYYELIRKLQPNAVIAIMGPDIRWVGTESGQGRETEWSVVPVSNSDPKNVADRSQKSDNGKLFVPTNFMDKDLGSRDKIKDAAALMWYPSEVDVSIRPGWFYHQNQDSLVKTANDLVNIYFASVGRNAVLLLNVPPDTRGLINDNDIKSLKGMRSILDSLFSVNYAKGAKISASNGKPGIKPDNMIDDDNKTYWSTKPGITDAQIELTLKNSSTFNCLMLQENFRNGQRIEEFSLEAFIKDEWKEIVKGTTIGYKRLLRFPEITTGKVRLNILKARDCPEISNIGLY